MNKTRMLESLKRLFLYKNGLVGFIIANVFILVFAPTHWLYYDVRYFIEWVDVIKQHGLFSVYSYAHKVAYPPIPVIVFTLMHTFASSITSSTYLIRLIDKIPLILAFNIIYYLLRKHYGLSAAHLWLVSYASYLTIFAYQFDLLTVLFLLASFIELIKKNPSPLRLGLYNALYLLVKQGLVFLAFIPLIYLLKKYGVKPAMKYVLAGLATGLVFILPFIIYDPCSFIEKVLFFHSARYPQELSLWAIPVYLSNFNYTIIPTWYSWLWFPIYLFATIYLLYKFYRCKQINDKIVLKYIILLLIVLLVTNKVGNENYLVWIVPFLAIYLSLHPEYRDLRLIYIVLPVMSSLLFPLVTYFAAAVAQGSLLIMEDLSHYSAMWLMERSFERGAIIFPLIDYARIYFYGFFDALYKCMWVSSTIFVVFYNVYLLYVFKKIYSIKYPGEE